MLELGTAHVVTSEVLEAVWLPLTPPAAPRLARTLVEAAEARPRFNSPSPFSLPASRPLLRERSKVIPEVGARGRSEAELEDAEDLRPP